MTKMLLLDVNIWLAMAIDSHVHHDAALSWFDEMPNDRSCLFCRMTQQGFLRLITNPRVLRGHSVQLPVAWQLFDQYLSDARVGFRHEPANLEEAWRTFTQNESFSPDVWNDAYLAAFAVVAGLEIVTFDKGFTKFPGLRYRILS